MPILGTAPAMLVEHPAHIYFVFNRFNAIKRPLNSGLFSPRRPLPGNSVTGGSNVSTRYMEKHIILHYTKFCSFLKEKSPARTAEKNQTT